MSTHTEKDLQQRSMSGDQAAFAEIFQLYKFKLYGFTLRLTGSPETAEDVVQNVFLKLWQDRHLLGEIDNLGGYIYRMAQNQVINGWKRMAKETILIRRLLTGQPDFSPSTPETELAYKEMERSFRQAIDKLPAQQKKVFLLSREEGLKYDEIAQRLQISPGTVKNHMIQLLRTLREQLENNLHSPAGLYCFLLVIAAFEK